MRRSVSTPLVLALALAGALAGCYSVPPDVRKTPVRPDAEPAARPIGGGSRRRIAFPRVNKSGYIWSTVISRDCSWRGRSMAPQVMKRPRRKDSLRVSMRRPWLWIGNVINSIAILHILA